MNINYTKAFLCAVVGAGIAMFAACGDDSGSNPRKSQTLEVSADDLSACSKKNDGELHVVDSVPQICVENEWKVLPCGVDGVNAIAKLTEGKFAYSVYCGDARVGAIPNKYLENCEIEEDEDGYFVICGDGSVISIVYGSTVKSSSSSVETSCDSESGDEGSSDSKSSSSSVENSSDSSDKSSSSASSGTSSSDSSSDANSSSSSSVKSSGSEKTESSSSGDKVVSSSSEPECDDSYIDNCQNTEQNVGQIYRCVDGKIVKETCAGKNSCNTKTNTCGECRIGGFEETCKNDDKYIGQLSRCVDGKIVTEACADNNSCNTATNTCGECKVDDFEETCLDNEKNIGQWTRCVEGKIVTEACGGNNSCDTKTNTCGECRVGNFAETCENNEKNVGQLTHCVEGRIVTNACDDYNSCDPETNKCGECWNGNTLCENDPDTQIGHSQKCIEGKYVVGGAFADGTFLEGMSCGSVSCLKNVCGYCLNGMHKWCDAKDPSLTSVWACENGGIDKTLCSTVESGSRCHSATTGDAYCAK